MSPTEITQPWLRLIVAAVGLAILSSPGPLTAQEQRRESRTISVSGTGKVSARPDVAEIQLGVVTEAPTAAAALQGNNEAMNRLATTLKERGIAEKDIQTVQIQVMPRYTQPQPRRPVPGEEAGEFIPRIFGYRVENSVRITARQIDKLGPLLDAVVGGGVNQVRGISFHVEKVDKLLVGARKDAVENAWKKARDLAESAHVDLGLPLKIEEHGGGVPVPQPRMYSAGPMMAAAPAMAVSPGEQELSVTVSVVYELLPRK